MRVLAVALAALLATAHCAKLVEPITAKCFDGASVVLTVREARVTLNSGPSFMTRAYHFNGKPMVPGPTIRMKAGQRCTITVINALPPQTPAEEARCFAAHNTTREDGLYHSNMDPMHCPSVIGFHTHGTALWCSAPQDVMLCDIACGRRIVGVAGLHVSPNEDNVAIAIRPGGRNVYTYTVPPKHQRGTHW